jgi:Spy/CpxP family protein refolding chaperone
MSRKKVLVLTLVVAFMGLSLAAGSRVFSYYRGYHHFASGDHGEFTGYLIERWKERLDLTDTQADQIRALIEATGDERVKSREYFRTKGKEMVELFFEEGTTKEQLEAEMADMQDEVSKMMTTYAGLAIDLRDTLTPEQLEKVKTYYEEKRSCRFK